MRFTIMQIHGLSALTSGCRPVGHWCKSRLAGSAPCLTGFLVSADDLEDLFLLLIRATGAVQFLVRVDATEIMSGTIAGLISKKEESTGDHQGQHSSYQSTV